jgi:hypothetical protein
VNSVAHLCRKKIEKEFQNILLLTHLTQPAEEANREGTKTAKALFPSRRKELSLCASRLCGKKHSSTA